MFKGLSKILWISVLVIFLAAGCGESSDADSDSANVDAHRSKALITGGHIPAIIGSTDTLLIYPVFIGEKTSSLSVELGCKQARTVGRARIMAAGIYTVQVEATGKVAFGPCPVIVNGTVLDSKPELETLDPCAEDGALETERDRSYAIAALYAPTFFQDVGRRPEADQIAPFDFDGNWAGNDNWEDLGDSRLEAQVYYSTVETTTHVFLTYTIFHPVRYGTFVENSTESHENSMTGVMVVLEKSRDGLEFLLMETYYDGQFLVYSDSPKVRRHSERVYDVMVFDNFTHPAVFVEAGRHGALVDLPFVFGEYLGEDGDFPGGDGIVYRFKGQAEVPKSDNDRDVGYELVPLLETLWNARDSIGDGAPFDAPFSLFENCTYPGRFDGDNYQIDAAAPPWGWDDIDDGDVSKGEWFLLPATTIASHVKIKGPFSTRYTYNPYLGIR